jgi:hypothetical protein
MRLEGNAGAMVKQRQEPARGQQKDEEPALRGLRVNWKPGYEVSDVGH